MSDNQNLEKVALSGDETIIDDIATQDLDQDLIDKFLPIFQSDLKQQLEETQRALDTLQELRATELASATCKMNRVQNIQQVIISVQNEYDKIRLRWERLSGIEQVLAALEGQNG